MAVQLKFGEIKSAGYKHSDAGKLADLMDTTFVVHEVDRDDRKSAPDGSGFQVTYFLAAKSGKATRWYYTTSKVLADQAESIRAALQQNRGATVEVSLTTKNGYHIFE